MSFPDYFQHLVKYCFILKVLAGRLDWGFTQLDTNGTVGSSGAWHPNRRLKSPLGGEFP